MTSAPVPRSDQPESEPTWDAVQLLPNQGQWTEADYFGLHTNRMAELVNGNLEVLPMPTWLHQLMVDFLVTALKRHVAERGLGGVVLFSPLPSRLFPGTVREPDVLYISSVHMPREQDEYPERLDLVMEVVSKGSDARKRDYVDKPLDYARAGIAEYWIVDPEQKLITVLGLQGGAYAILGRHSEGDTARSRYLDGFALEVTPLLSVGKKR